jgi:hypothetical protein
MAKYHLANSVIKIIHTLKSNTLRYAVIDFINYTPIDFVVNWDGAFRTAEQQNQKFIDGYSNCDGYKYKSAHQSGLAVDLVPWINGKATWDLEHAKALGGAFKTYCNMKGIPIQWGGDWADDGVFQKEDFDPYHFEEKK